MDFIGIGGWEVLLILVIAVIVLGPGRLVEFSRKLGKVTRTFKKAASDLTSQVTKEIEAQDKASPPQKRRDA